MAKKDAVTKITTPVQGTIVKSIKKYVSENSEQLNDKKHVDVVHPIVDFRLLTRAVEQSFIIGGIIDMIAKNADTGFVEIKFDSLEEGSNITQDQVNEINTLMADFDVQLAIKNLASFGNYFLEVVGVLPKKTDQQLSSIELVPFITKDCKLQPDWDLKQQNSNGSKVFPRYKQRATGKTKKGQSINTFLQLKLQSLSTRYYGDSLFAKCITQLVVLEQIDQLYERYFERGLIKSKFLLDPENELTERDENIIKATVEDAMRGDSNSFEMAIVHAALTKLDIEDEFEIKGLLEYRRDLMRSICIAINMPYDLLDSINSNKATSEVAMDQFNQKVVKPLQEIFLRELRKGLRPFFGEVVDYLRLNTLDTEDEKERMEILTGYIREGAMTANEARALSPYELPEIEGGDTLRVNNTKPIDTQANIASIKKHLSKMYD